MVEFPISGVETYWWLPMLVAFCISSITSTGGVTGAFILLPFAVSVLGYDSPGVSPTNMLYNVVAIPSGVYRFHRENRMLWSMAWTTGIGTLPGLVLGAMIRLKYLPDPRSFKLFVGLVLLYLGGKLVQDLIKKRRENSQTTGNGNRLITRQVMGLNLFVYDYEGETYSVKTWPIIAISFVVGIVGGIYGIGGGATICPGVTVGRNTFIGAGSLVNKDVPPDTLAYGVPARHHPLPDSLSLIKPKPLIRLKNLTFPVFIIKIIKIINIKNY